MTKISTFNQCNPETPEDRIPCSTNSKDSASDNNKIEGRVYQIPDLAFHERMSQYGVPSLRKQKTQILIGKPKLMQRPDSTHL